MITGATVAHTDMALLLSHGFSPVFGEFTGQRLVNSKTASLKWIWTPHLLHFYLGAQSFFFRWFRHTNRVHNRALGAPGKLNFTPFNLSTLLAHLHWGSATLNAFPNPKWRRLIKHPHSGSAATLKKKCCVHPGRTENKLQPQTCTVDSFSVAFIQIEQIGLQNCCTPFLCIFAFLCVFAFRKQKFLKTNCGGCGLVHVWLHLKINYHTFVPEWEHGCALICVNDDKLLQSAWQRNYIILLQAQRI